ncbi:class I SAM-dependent methyltransferase [Terrimonas sp. NA20]|uniref:Class I SAM-dependent methyltransferase n=1 Tax=Terrimonas ginsenosidimutans TaxID=2908004 RepID=A0ABS9KUU5_9BACT|nr:class I SAM-dependent methyltransferase [Terrimonas ginsenosidimutans]MCG2616080.1 class I SAM-dependent methyltransferase [Terrimonas ginsenosidimutans]
MKIVLCPVCGSSDAEKNLYKPFVVDSLSYEIVRCKKCRHYFTFFNVPVDIDKYYDEKDYTVKDTRNSVFYKIQEAEYKKVLKRLEQLAPKERALIDFGAGKGLFLSFAANAGYEVAGVETSTPRAEYARKVFDVQISSDFYSGGVVFGKRFPVITMFHVLEHIPDAKSLLGNLLNDNLDNDGVAVVEVPNFGSWQSKWGRERWLHIDIPRHVSHFTSESLTRLLDSLGYKIIRKDTFSLHLGIIGMIQTIMSKFGYRGFLIGDLKAKKNIRLMAGLMAALPFAFILEWFSSLTGRGGVLRYYVRKEVKG